MDILFFLRLRTGFIRQHYDACAAPFVERIRLIDAAEPPFEDANRGEEDEPAYLQEWMDADTSLQLVGMSCVSLLSDSLKLYLNLLQEKHPRFVFTDRERRRLKTDFLGTFRDALGDIYATDWSDTGVDFAVIEQVPLARNRAQHGTDLTDFGILHDDHTLSKHPLPFFISDLEARSLERTGAGSGGFLAPMVKITREKLFAAIDEVERLAEWIDANSERALPWIRAQQARHGARVSDDGGPASWPGMLPAFITRLSEAAERAVELRLEDDPLVIEVEPTRLDDDAYRQSLLDRAKTWRGGSDLSTIYVFSYEAPVPQELVALVRNDANVALRKIGEERGFAKVNKSRESRCLYVGHTFKVETRLRDHFGFGTPSTSSLHLWHWSGHPHKTVTFTAYRLSTNDRLLVPWLEEFLWDELKPLLGKRGGK